MRPKNYFTTQLTKLILLFLVINLGSSCNEKEDQESQHIKLVKTANVNEISSIKQKQFPGIIKEAEEVNLAFRVAGPIKEINVKEGDFVKKGQLIAEMDPRDYEVQKNAVEAQAIQLKSEYERVEELNNRKSVADNDFEKMKAGKEMIEAKLKNANDQLNDTKLYAPFTGYITKVNFENGELVNQGTPIVSMIDVSILKVEIDVPASMFLMKEKITNIECTQEDIPDINFPLILKANNVKANNNGLYRFYLQHIPSVDSKLNPGMNVSVIVSYNVQNRKSLNIPLKAIFEKDDNSYVWVVKDSLVNMRKVETNNILNSGNIGITGGLQAGEQIVIGGLNLLKENEKVRSIPEQSKTNVGNIL
jgi:RND family efflux transporter MFP subunit